VGRLAYTTTEERIKREFEIFGALDYVRLVRDPKTEKSRGYAFVTFMRERDANYAIQKADGRKVDGKRILVDREMGRTSERWFPRRLGGGKGGESRRSDADYIVKEVQRELRREQQDLEDLKIREDMKASDQIKSEQAHHSGAKHNAAHLSAAEDDANEEREPGEL